MAKVLSFISVENDLRSFFVGKGNMSWYQILFNLYTINFSR